MVPLVRTLELLLIIATLTGCAASVTRGAGGTSGTGSAGESTRIVVSEVAAKRVLLSMTGPAGYDSGPDWEASKEEWQTSMTAATSASGSAFSFADGAAGTTDQPSVLIKMKVNEYRYVSQAKRYGLGVFTGNAYLDIDVEFIELPSSRSVGTRKYSSSSSFIHGIFAAMTPKQVEAVSKEIVREIDSK